MILGCIVADKVYVYVDMTGVYEADSKAMKAYRAWRKATERGYPKHDNTYDAMKRTDERIRRLKAKYESLLTLAKGGR